MKSGRVVYCPNVKEWQRPGRDTFQRYTHTHTASLPVKSPLTQKVGAHKIFTLRCDQISLATWWSRRQKRCCCSLLKVVLFAVVVLLVVIVLLVEGFSLGVLGRQRRCRRARCICASLTSSLSNIFIVINIVTVVEGVRVDAFCAKRRRRGTTSSSSPSSSSSRLRGRRIESRDWIRVREAASDRTRPSSGSIAHTGLSWRRVEGRPRRGRCTRCANDSDLRNDWISCGSTCWTRRRSNAATFAREKYGRVDYSSTPQGCCTNRRGKWSRRRPSRAWTRKRASRRTGRMPSAQCW